MTLTDWLIHCQKIVCIGVFARSMPAVGMVLAGTKADMRPGKNIVSPVTG